LVEAINGYPLVDTIPLELKGKMWKGNLKSPYFSASLSFGAEGEENSKIKNKQVPKLRINRTDG
jgi:hypothetical protein